jgi:hypothetical protein
MADWDRRVWGGSREEAKARGYREYDTGKPCIYGHRGPRYVSDPVTELAGPETLPDPAQCIHCLSLRNDRTHFGISFRKLVAARRRKYAARLYRHNPGT